MTPLPIATLLDAYTDHLAHLQSLPRSTQNFKRIGRTADRCAQLRRMLPPPPHPARPPSTPTPRAPRYVTLTPERIEAYPTIDGRLCWLPSRGYALTPPYYLSPHPESGPERLARARAHMTRLSSGALLPGDVPPALICWRLRGARTPQERKQGVYKRIPLDPRDGRRLAPSWHPTLRAAIDGWPVI